MKKQFAWLVLLLFVATTAEATDIGRYRKLKSCVLAERLDSISDLENKGWTVNGNPTVVNTAKGNAIDFDGNSDYAYGIPLDNMPEVTIMGRVTVDTWGDWVGAWCYSIDKRNDEENYIVLQADNASKFKISMEAGDSNVVNSTGSTTIETGQMYHIAMTVKANEAKLYINGSQDNTTDDSVTMFSGQYVSVGIGASAGYTFNGKLQDFMVFNRVLSAQEISDIYNDVSFDFWNTIFTDYDTSGATTTTPFSDTVRTNISNNVKSDASTSLGLTELQIEVFDYVESDLTKTYTGDSAQFSVAKQPLDLVPDVTDTSLVGAWLNKRVRGSGDDLSSNNNDLSYVSNRTPNWLTIGAGFTGNDYINIADNDSLDFGTGEFTVYCWVQPHDVVESDKNIISKWGWDSDVEGWYFGSSGDGRVFLTFGDGTDSTQMSTVVKTLVVDEYTLLVCTRDLSGMVRGYANGELMSGPTSVTYDLDTSAQFAIGSDGWRDRNFNGAIKDARLYNEAKSANWIAAEYAKAVPEDDLVLHVVDGEDVSRYRHTVTNNGATLGNGMEFDGNEGTYLDLGTAINDDIQITDDFTVRMWVKADTVATNQAVFCSSTAWADSWSIYSNVVTFGVGKFNGTSYYDGASSTIIADKWYHVVFINNNDSASFYLNGVLATGDPTGSIDSNSKTTIGAKVSGGVAWDGKVRDVKVYTAPKSIDWILNDYNETKKYF